MTSTPYIKNTRQRVVFIDLLRAYAILMMVQGHFIEVTLQQQYCSAENFIFLAWASLRGITAPLFFFASGTIFSYLLFKAEKEDGSNGRISKGIKRFGLLVGLGYLLRLQPAISTELFNFNSPAMMPFWAIDTLHCIGFGILFIILIYKSGKYLRINHAILFAFFALLIFLISPIIENSSFILNLPIPIASFFTNKYGSNFPIIPWTGFVLWGGMLGYLIAKNLIDYTKYTFSIIAVIIGLIFILFSGDFLIFIYNSTSIELFKILYFKNILFLHLGTVLFTTGIFSFISNIIPIPKIIKIVGNSTLMIYIVHIFIIYGTAFTLGINHWYAKSLNPYQSITFAIILIIFFMFLAYYYENIKRLINKNRNI